MHSSRLFSKRSFNFIVGLSVFIGAAGLPAMAESMSGGVTAGTSQSGSAFKQGTSKTGMPTQSPGGNYVIPVDKKQELKEINVKQSYIKGVKTTSKVNSKVSNKIQNAINEIEAQSTKETRAPSTSVKKPEVVEYKWKGDKIKSKKVVNEQ